jgi:hypothetical protein
MYFIHIPKKYDSFINILTYLLHISLRLSNDDIGMKVLVN